MNHNPVEQLESQFNTMPSTYDNQPITATSYATNAFTAVSSSTMTAATVSVLLKESENVSYDSNTDGLTTPNDHTLLIKNWNKSWSLIPQPELLFTRLCFIFYCEILSPIPHSLTKNSTSGFVPVSVVKLLWHCIISTHTEEFQDKKEEADEMVGKILQNLTSKFGFFIQENIVLQDSTTDKDQVIINCIKFSNKMYQEYGFTMRDKEDYYGRQMKNENIKKGFVKSLLKEIGLKNNFLSMEENYEDFLTTSSTGKPIDEMYNYVIVSCCYLLPCLTCKAPTYYLLEPKFTHCRLSVLDVDHGTSIAVSDVEAFANSFESPTDQVQAFEVIASCVHAASTNNSDRDQEQTETSIKAAHAFMTVAKSASAMSYNPSKYYREALVVYEEILDSYLHESNASHENIILFDMAESMQKLGNYVAYENSGLILEDVTKCYNPIGSDIPKLMTPLNHRNCLKNLATAKNDTTVNHESMELYDRVFQIRRGLLGAQHPLVANTLHCIGVLYFEAKLYSNALGCFTETLRIRRNAFSSNSLHQRQVPSKALVSRNLELRIAETLEWIGLSHHELKKVECAITNFNEALVIKSIHYSKDHEGIASLYQKIGALHFKVGKYQASILQFNEALRIRRLCYQQNLENKNKLENVHCMENILETLCCLGDVYCKVSNKKHALDCYVEAMTLQKTILHDRLPDFQHLTEVKDVARVLPLPVYIHLSNSSPLSANSEHLTTLASLTSDDEDDILQEMIRTTPGLYSDFRQLFTLMADIIELSTAKYGEDHSEVSSRISQIADLYIQTGNYKKAIKCLKEVLRILSLVDEKEEGNRKMMIHTMNRLAVCYSRVFDMNTSIGFYESLLDELDEELESVDSFFDMHLPSTSSEKEDVLIDSGDDSFIEIDAILEKFVFGNVSTAIENKCFIDRNCINSNMEHLSLISDIFYNLGNAQSSTSSKGCYDRAFSTLFHALMIRQHFYLSEKPSDGGISVSSKVASKKERLIDFANAYHCLVVCYVLISGNFERGCDIFECEILPMYEKCYGDTNPYHASIGHACYYLGQMYQGLAVFGRSSLDDEEDEEDEGSDKCILDKALEYYNRAICTYRVNYKKDHILFGHVYLSVGSIYDSRSMFTDAVQWFNSTLTVYRNFNKSGQHLGVAIVLNSLGISCAMNGEEKEALKYFQMSYNLRKTLVGDRHAIVSDSLYNMGGVYAKLGLHNDSVSCYQKCLEIRVETYGDSNLLVAKTYNNMGVVHTQLNKYHLAIVFFKEVLRILQSVIPLDSESLASVYCNIGNIHALKKTSDTAMEYYRESLRIYRTLHGKDSSIIANILHKMEALDIVKIDVDSNEVATEFVIDPHLV